MLASRAAGGGSTMAAARTNGPYYGDLEAPGELSRAIRLVSRDSHLMLLHGNRRRERLLVNLVAQLNDVGVFHVLLLGFATDADEASICDGIRSGGRIGCATSSYLRTSGPAELIKAVRKRELPARYLSWLQRFRYLRLLMEARVDVVALDSDVAVRTDPSPLLRAAELGDAHLVTTFDYKGGFANTNCGFMAFRNCSVGGPIHTLLRDFERRIALALPLPPSVPWRGRASHASQFLWDQNVWNKVEGRKPKAQPSVMAYPPTLAQAILSHMAGHAAYLPDGSDAAWTAAHKPLLRARHYWREAEYATPLAAAPPWFPRHARALWHDFGAAAAGSLVPPSAGTAAAVERMVLAPAWLVAMENGIGHKLKHVAYGATPAPAALLHYTCVQQTESARIWPLRLLGGWRGEEAPSRGGEVVAAPRLLGLVGATLDAPLTPPPWAELNALHLLLGGLAAAAGGRRPVLPALNCSGAAGGPLRPSRLSNRCFWHVPTAQGARCVLRIGWCDEAGLATPNEVCDGRPRRLTLHLPLIRALPCPCV